MAITKKALAIQAVKELRKIRAEKDAITKRENELKKTVQEYLITAPNETLDTIECNAKLRHSVKFKISKDTEKEAVILAILLKEYSCLKVNGTAFAETLKKIDKNADLDLYGKYVDEVAVLLTYRKD